MKHVTDRILGWSRHCSECGRTVERPAFGRVFCRDCQVRETRCAIELPEEPPPDKNR